MSGEIPFLTHHFPEKRKDLIRRDIYAQIYDFIFHLNPIEANRDTTLIALRKFYPRDRIENKIKEEEDKGYHQCMDSWIRALGNRIANKRHLIDALVLTTKQLN